MNKFLYPVVTLLLLFHQPLQSQLSGTYTVPGSYASVAAAITALNSQGVNGPVTILINAGLVETAPSGGYSLTATGTATSPIAFRKAGTGANPQLNAPSGGSGVPSSAIQDGIWKFIGCDHITIDGINLVDPNSSNPSTMEYGFGFFRSSATNGCQQDSIKNCVITLKRVNNAAGAGVASEGSRGIDVVNASASTHTTALAVTNASGANSFNHFCNNLIQNCNIGIAIIGFADLSPFTFADYNNDIGGTSAATSNTIVNYGGGTASQNAYGIKTLFQYNLNASNNYINSNDGAGLYHSGGLYGVFTGSAVSANVSVNNNTVTLKGIGTSFFHYGILIASASATSTNNIVNITGNLITDCSYTTAVNGVFHGINNSANGSTINVTNNTIRSGTCSSASGYFCITNYGAGNNVNISSNQAYNMYFQGPTNPFPPFYFINVNSSILTQTLTISSNSVSSINMTPGVPGSFYGIRVWTSQTSAKSVITNNVFGPLTIAADGTVFLISESDYTPNTLVSGNITSGSIAATGSTGAVYCYHRTGTSAMGAGAATITANNFSNINANDNAFFGIYHAAVAQQTISITSNTISNISAGNAPMTGITHSLGTNSDIRQNLFTAFTGSNTITGILLNGLVTGTLNVSSNTLSSFASAGSNSVCGYYQGSNSNVNFRYNKINDLSGSTAASQIFGVFTNTGSTTNIGNNIIGNLLAPAANHSNAVNGIYINGGSTANVYYNTVRLNASSSGADFGSSAIYASATPTVDLRYNVLINLSTPNGIAITTAYRRNAAGLNGYASASNYNLFYAGTPSASNLLFSDGTNQLQSLSALKSFLIPREALSVTENISFLSTVGSSSNFLHVDPNSQSLIESRGVNAPGYTVDIDSDIRHGNSGYVGTGSAPDIGADEYEGVFPNCTTVGTPTISALAPAVCVGQTLNVLANPQTPNPGLVSRWLVSSSPTGSYSVLPGPNATSYSTVGLTPGIYYYRFANTCTITNSTDTSNIISVQVSSFPTLAISAITNTYCTGGDPVVLTASGASSYSWSPGTALNSTSIAAVSASPANTTTYVVVGSNPGNCTGTSSIVVVRLPSAGGITVTPSSTTMCQGNNLNLQAVSSNFTYSVSPIAYNPIPTPATGYTVLCNNGLIVTWPQLAGLDDGGWDSQPIPFTFNFFDVGYTAFMACTNGFITLGSGLPNTVQDYHLALPNVNAGRPGIGAVYSDLDFSFVGGMNYFTSGTAPNRKLVVNWNNGRYYTVGQGTGVVTTQIILYETSNVIEVHTTNCTGYDAAVEGIQNAAGTQAFVVPGRNNTTYTLTNDAYRWSLVKNVSWQPSTYLNSTTSFTPTAQNLQGNIVYTVSATTGNGCTVSATSSVSVVPSPTILISPVSTPVCAGTNLTLTASGANTFTWNTGPQNATLSIAPVVTSTYTASGTSTLNTCIGYATQIVTVIPIPTLAITGSPSLCAGHIETYSVSGADTYSWSTGSTNPTFTFAAITNSVYSVTGTNTLTSCSTSTQLSISVYPNPTVSVSGSSVICSGQNASLSATGANSYAWSNGANTPGIFPSPLVLTVYSVTGLSSPANCSNTAAFTVNIIPSPTISVSSSTQICSGTSVNLSASGANTYTWSNGASGNSVTVSPTSITVYTVSGTGTLNTCVGYVVTVVAVKPVPSVSIQVAPSLTVCPGESVELTGTSNTADSFVWSNASNDGSIVVTPTLTTTYSLTVSNSTTGCQANANVQITVDPCTGLRLHAADEISVYPNPVENKLFVKNVAGIKIVYELGDMNGRILLNGNLGENKNIIPMDGLAKGIYYLRMKGDENRVYRIVKQ